jgi:hypothetical protein
MKLKSLFVFVCLACFAHSTYSQLSPTGATASFKGSLPPKPAADISSADQAALEKELAGVTTAFQSVKKHERAADADIFIKAVRYALEFHEWYDKKPEDGPKKARALLAEASARIEGLKKNETPWLNGSGVKVLGFYSQIDDSPQPYGVEVPEGLEYGAGKKAVPMWIWLHGRGDTSTDIHFIASQMKSKGGQFKPAGTIVIHPFGRYCNGFKSAGETDVLECKADATKRFNVDTNRIAIAGFSMGGAGAWHLGAHHAEQWACVHTGAGFVDVKRYQKLTPDKYPAWYEQKLWGFYDVPDYARNFLNVPLVSYSGEVDAQRDSAEYMMEVLAKEGLHPPHLIGPGMPHKYHPETIKEVQKLIEAAVAKGREVFPDEVHIQTQTPYYGRMKWMNLHGMEESWKEARLDAKVVDGGTIEIKTTNVARIVFYPPPQARKGNGSLKVIVDGATLNVSVGAPLPQFESMSNPGPRTPETTPKITAALCRLIKENGKWRDFGSRESFQHDSPEGGKPASHPGPMDVSFMKRFLVVLPDGKSSSPSVDAWVDAESAHFLKRWRSLMRGDVRVAKASDITDVHEAGKTQSLILWGTPESNSCIRAVVKSTPLRWDNSKVGMNPGPSFDSRTHVPLLTYPCLKSPGFEVVMNSGLTFREAHDRTNSLQNPKLPDWAILDITQAPNSDSAGKVVAADFFDEHWQVKPEMPPVDRK